MQKNHENRNENEILYQFHDKVAKVSFIVRHLFFENMLIFFYRVSIDHFQRFYDLFRKKIFLWDELHSPRKKVSLISMINLEIEV